MDDKKKGTSDGSDRISLNVKPDVKQAFKNYQNNYEGTGNEFVKKIMALLDNENKDPNIKPQLSEEQATVRKKLNEAENVVNSFLTLAADDKKTAIEESKDKVFKAEQEVFELKEIVKNQKIEIIELKENTNKQENTIKGLQESAETTADLKLAWENEKNTLSLRITDLDSEAQEARKLKTSVISLEKTLAEKETLISDYKGKINLVDQLNKSNEGIINGLNKQLNENKDTVAEQKEDLKGLATALKISEDNLNSARVQAKDNEISLRDSHTKEKDKLIENRTSLEKDQFAYIQLQKEHIELKKELDVLKKE